MSVDPTRHRRYHPRHVVWFALLEQRTLADHLRVEHDRSPDGLSRDEMRRAHQRLHVPGAAEATEAGGS